MDFNYLLDTVGNEPFFETSLLLAGEVDPNDARRQLSRWVKAGKIFQLRRGLYTLAPPFQKTKPHPFVVANRMARGSYVSVQSALAYYGLIPDTMNVTVSVTTQRPARWKTPLGDFEFRHIKPALLFGYKLTVLDNSQRAFIAAPAKALLDLIHLSPASNLTDYLNGLRLQNLERLDVRELNQLAAQSRVSKWKRAAQHIAELAQAESKEYETL